MAALYRRKCLFILLVLLVAVGGCSTVPKEVVELSYSIGKDLGEIHRTYKALITVHFDDLRQQVNSFIDTEWKPTFLKKFVREGKLVEDAKMSDPSAVLERVTYWSELAIKQIEAEKKKLLGPIDAQEKALERSIDDAFSRLVTANSTITAHLNSLREVEEVQDKLLETLHVKSLRNQINTGLITASESAQKGISDLAKAEGIEIKAGQFESRLKSILGKE